MTYETYLEGMNELLRRFGVTDFGAHELATPEGGVPPRELWPNAIPTIIRIQRLRTRLGRAIYICTPAHPRRGYRTAEVNAAVGGASGSIHLTFNAFDCHAPGLAVADLLEAARLEFPIDDRVFWGLGQTYPTFVHMDTRGLLGLPAPARW